MQKPVKSSKQPWPTQKAMQQVYEMNLWGGDRAFYSGEGSHDSRIIEPYIKMVIQFLKSFENEITVCDLGCGDFNVGKELVAHTKHYIAIDIVPELIAHNKNAFKQDHLEFQCVDLAKDTLPKGDCALLRQVLQHVSNAEVASIQGKLKQYTYVILTEHVPNGPFVPNLDIISGQGTRLKKGSGIDLFSAPFDFEVQSKKDLLSVPSPCGKGSIVTTLLEL